MTRVEDRDTTARAAEQAKRDIALLWIDARFAGATMKRRPDADVLAADDAPEALLGRIEDELAGEAHRYRHALWACLAIGVMPVVLAVLAWSGLYWLPVRILWQPFERGMYGLPWLSLYEWVAYLLLAGFFAYGFALIAESHGSTRRLSADYRRLHASDPVGRERYAREVVSARLLRTAFVLRTSAAFAEYRPLLDAAEQAAL